MTAKSLIKIVSVSEMVAIEKQADKGGITYQIMMQNAGAGLAKVIEKKYQHIENKHLIAFIGKGNNGGDALVALDALNQSGWQTNVYIVGERNPKDALIQKAVNSGSELIWHKDDPSFEQIDKCLENTQLWLDGLLGTGIKLPLRPPISNLLDHLSDILAMYEKKPALIAIDCPSGIDCDTGEVADQTLPADLTVCMEAVKQGVLKFPAFEYLGELQVVSIGLPAELGLSDHIDNFLIDQTYVNSHLPERPRTAHKGTFGKVLVIAGSANFPGAALFAGRAAFRVGAG